MAVGMAANPYGAHQAGREVSLSITGIVSSMITGGRAAEYPTARHFDMKLPVTTLGKRVRFA